MNQFAAALLIGCGGIVTVAGAAGVIWWLVAPRVKSWAETQILTPVRETHHQVTVNHHSSDEPTVLDKLSDLEHAIADVATENLKQNHEIAGIRTDVSALTTVLDAHLRGGDIGDDEPDLN